MFSVPINTFRRLEEETQYNGAWLEPVCSVKTDVNDLRKNDLYFLLKRVFLIKQKVVFKNFKEKDTVFPILEAKIAQGDANVIKEFRQLSAFQFAASSWMTRKIERNSWQQTGAEIARSLLCFIIWGWTAQAADQRQTFPLLLSCTVLGSDDEPCRKNVSFEKVLIAGYFHVCQMHKVTVICEAIGIQESNV